MPGGRVRDVPCGEAYVPGVEREEGGNKTEKKVLLDTLDVGFPVGISRLHCCIRLEGTRKSNYSRVVGRIGRLLLVKICCSSPAVKGDDDGCHNPF